MDCRRWLPARRRAIVTRAAVGATTERPLAGPTTHVLDVTRGGPAEGVRVELYEIASSRAQAFADAATNVDGRTDSR